MAKHVIEYAAKCSSCKGTGIYVGLAERDGCGVVCHKCKGSGCYHGRLEYEDFEARVKRDGIKRVLQANPGIVVGAGKNLTLTDFGGMDYEDWFAYGAFPPRSEMRRFTCPAWWYQSADYKKRPDWNECKESIGRSFSACSHFSTKAECWKRWDEAYKQHI